MPTMLLLGVFLHGVAAPVAARTRRPYRAVLGSVVILLFVLAALCVWLVGPALAAQLEQLSMPIPTELALVRRTFEHLPMLHSLSEPVDRPHPPRVQLACGSRRRRAGHLQAGASMARRSPLREVLERLKRELADAVLDVVRRTPLRDLRAVDPVGDPPAPQRSSRSPAAPRSRPPSSRARLRSGRNPAQAASKRVRAEDSTVITDPGAILAALEQTARAVEEGHAKHAAPRSEASPPERPNAPSPPPAPPVVAEGEEVLRASDAGVVVRRRRPVGSRKK